MLRKRAALDKVAALADVQHALLGHSVAATFGERNSDALTNADSVERILRGACDAAGYKIVSGVSHDFQSYGATCALILAQSHIIAHSWPEYGVLVVDLFACAPGHTLNIALSHI